MKKFITMNEEAEIILNGKVEEYVNDTINNLEYELKNKKLTIQELEEILEKEIETFDEDMMNDAEEVTNIDMYEIKILEDTSILINLELIEYNEENAKESIIKVLTIY